MSSMGTFCCELCKNSWTNRNGVWGVNWGGAKQACVRWGAHWQHLASTTELSMCGGDVAFLSNYFDHLSLFCSFFVGHIWQCKYRLYIKRTWAVWERAFRKCFTPIAHWRTIRVNNDFEAAFRRSHADSKYTWQTQHVISSWMWEGACWSCSADKKMCFAEI